MSDSGRQIGDCSHGYPAEYCLVCAKAERDRLREKVRALGASLAEAVAERDAVRRILLHSPLGGPPEDGPRVQLHYTNHRGERAWRTVVPLRVYWGKTEWHPEEQYLLRVWDVDKGAERDYALLGLVGAVDRYPARLTDREPAERIT